MFFTSIILLVCGTPWEPISTQILCGPLIWQPQPMVKNIEGYHIFALGAPNPDKPPHVDPLPPIYGLPRPRSDPRDVDDVSMGPSGSGLVDCYDRSLVPWWIPSDRLSASTASPEPLLPRQQPRGRPARRAVTV